MNVEKYLNKIFFVETDKGVRFSKIRKRFVCRTKLHRYPNINEYLENKYSDYTDYHPYTDKETLFRIKNNIDEMPKCPVCGKIALFHDYEYRKYCSPECSHNDKEQYKQMVKTQQKNLKEKYGEGITNYAQLESTKKKIAETTLKHYGNTCFLGSEKSRELYKEKTGYDNPLQNPETKEKVKQTNRERYGNSYFLGSKQYMDNVIEIQNKITYTCIDKYGTNRYSQTAEYKNRVGKTWEDKPLSEISYFIEQQYNTKKENGTFATSNTEDETYEILKIKFPDVVRQYRSELYPYACDFYIPSLNLYIECNYTWTHGEHPYNENIVEDAEKLILWKNKSETSDYYKNAIYTWTDLDVRKQQCVIDNNLNFEMFYTIDDFKTWFEISLPYNKSELLDELEYYRNTAGKIACFSTKNNIVKYYQQQTFYKHEKELWCDKKIKEKLINNRIHYLQTNDFTAEELLRGFKISGIFYGYSHFHPLIVKYICEKYGTKICYDPCGGWGHHILGALNIDKYIYNDLSVHTYNNVCNIVRDLNINNVVCYNNDGAKFMPNEEFDTMISCPPYYNVESYECGDFKNIEEYNAFIDNLFNVFNNKQSCGVFALIIREDLIDINKHIPTEIFELSQSSSHLIKEKKFKEKLYIFKK